MSDTTDSFGRDFRWWAMEAAKHEKRAENAEAKLAEEQSLSTRRYARAFEAEAKLAEVEKERDGLAAALKEIERHYGCCAAGEVARAALASPEETP